MDRNALLTATRAKFLAAFLLASDHALSHAKVSMLRKADTRAATGGSRALSDAYLILHDRQAELRHQLQVRMEQLLDRSFQTAYGTFRPSFSSDFTSDSLTLVDTGQLEDQLRVDELTTRFRNASENALRDLNIRVAVLFEQKTIKERENPFRPWLITRCITSAVEALGLRAELVPILSQLVAEHLEESVAVIYNQVNSYLAEHGIAAQLQLRGSRTPVSPETPPGVAARPGGNGLGSPAAASSRDSRVIDPDALPTLFSAEAVPTSAMFGAATPAHGSGSPGQDWPELDAVYSGNAVQDSAAQINRMIADVRQSAIRTEPAEVRMPDPTGLSEAVSDVALRAVTVAGPGLVPGNGGPGTTDLREHVRQLFGAGPAVATLQPGNAMRTSRAISPMLDHALDALLANHDRTDGAPSAASAMDPLRNVIFEQRAALFGTTGDAGEQVTIDVVAMLYEFILLDDRVPADVRALLGRLQVVVLKLALKETSLLARRSHPVRLLLNRIGTISIGIGQFGPPDARIRASIDRIIAALLSDDANSSTPYRTILGEFDLFLANTFSSEDSRLGRTVRAIETCRHRVPYLARLTAELEEALSGSPIDAFLRNFLLSTWTRVIEHAERDREGPVTVVSRFRQIVPELLWSIQPQARGHGRTRLMALLPTIVSNLREGLSMIGWNAERQQPVLDWLVEAHRSALRDNGDAMASPALHTFYRHFEKFVRGSGETSVASATPAGDVTRQEQILDELLVSAGVSVLRSDQLVDTRLRGTGDDTLTAKDPTAGASERESAGEVRERLHVGVPMELHLRNVAGRGFVKWIDQHSSILLISVEGSDAPACVTLPTLLHLLASGELRFAEHAMLFDRAIDSLLHAARLPP